jgi:mRNA (2'-O-methyladenosine-N6-)-methyltransferase
MASVSHDANGSLSRIYHHLSAASKTSLERLRQVLQEFGRKYAVGFGVRIDKDEVWLDWFNEVGIELAYVAEGYVLPVLGLTSRYGNEQDVQALKERRISKPEPTPAAPSLEYLLSYQTYMQRESAQQDEIQAAILEPTAMQNLALDRARAQSVEQHGYNPYRHYCPHKTFIQCLRTSMTPEFHVCDRVHFRPILRPHTDISLGDCSYLNTCHRMHDTCKYVHYELDIANSGSGDKIEESLMQEWIVNIPGRETGLWTGEPCLNRGELPSQWISCDVRRLDLQVLGKFGVLMMDPPWDIHMTLPYGTLTDDEMKDMKIQQLQDDGILLLWVTGRAMEVGRECLARWGYNRIDELVWVKTNQLQRLIRYPPFLNQR